jgi:hypothetical protein
MKLIWIDKNFPSNDKISSYQLDSSRTTDSISNLNNKEEIIKNEEKEISYFSNTKNNETDNNEETLNLLKNLKVEKISNSINLINFKKILSLVLCAIYLTLFLTNIPKIPVKIGDEQKIDVLIKNSTNKNINILINNLNFLCNKNRAYNNEGLQQNNEINNCETTGYLFEFSNNKIFIFRWIIGFSYFVVKCIIFIYSKNKTDNINSLTDKRKISYVQKISTLIFPLSLFYFDLQNNIYFTEITQEHIYNKSISFFIKKEKRFSTIDYIEGLIPTIFSFLISIDYRNLENIINNIFIKKKKLNKLV